MEPLRQHLDRLLDWTDAHASFDAAVDGLPAAARGVVPTGLPWSAWQLLEHLRLAQADILEFCGNAGYTEKRWPDDYWPVRPEPPSAGAWQESIAAYKRDLAALKQLVADPTVDLLAKVPAGSGQTYLREVLLVADHTAYHVGQLVAVRRMLGYWKEG